MSRLSAVDNEALQLDPNDLRLRQDLTNDFSVVDFRPLSPRELKATIVETEQIQHCGAQVGDVVGIAESVVFN